MITTTDRVRVCDMRTEAEINELEKERARQLELLHKAMPKVRPFNLDNEKRVEFVRGTIRYYAEIDGVRLTARRCRDLAKWLDRVANVIDTNFPKWAVRK